MKADRTSKKEVPQLTSMKELFNATKNGSRGTLLDDLLTSLLNNYNEASKRKAIDRWQPTKHCLEHMIKRLEILKYGELVSGAENNDATEYEKVCSMISLINDTIRHVESESGEIESDAGEQGQEETGCTDATDPHVENEIPKSEVEVDEQVQGETVSEVENKSEPTSQSDNSGELPSSKHDGSSQKNDKKEKPRQQSKYITSSTSSR